MIDGKDLLKIEEEDIDWAKDDVSISVNDSSIQDQYTTDLYDLYIYNKIKSLSLKSNVKFNYFDEEKTENLEKWDNELKNIIQSFNFTEETTDEDKIITIVNYVINKIEYDPIVSAQLKGDVLNRDRTLSRKYNQELLKTVFDSNSEYGICCNYAALTSVLSNYLNLDVDYTIGWGETMAHAWCTYNNDEESFVIDSTDIDTRGTLEFLKLVYDHAIDQEQKDFIKGQMNSTVFDNKERYENAFDYIVVYDYAKETEKKEKHITYINEKANEYYEDVYMKNIKTRTFLTFASALLLTANVVSTVKTKKEEAKTKMRVI